MTAVPRPIRIALPFLVVLALTACNGSQLLPPDYRLPDGSAYTGDTQNGMFHGDGTQVFPNGETYMGEFQEGYWHGEGELTSPAGWRYQGQFREGMMSGYGVLEDDESRYEGFFQNNRLDGKGRYEVNGDVYVAEFENGTPVKGMHITEYGSYQGEFSGWQYHGQGTYYYNFGPDDTGSLAGTWENGEFVEGDEYTPRINAPEQPEAALAETILAEDRHRLERQLGRLAEEQPGVTDAYFLAVGGDGKESVFMRDINVARGGLQTHFDIGDRAIMLLNHRDYESLPLATRPSIAAALKALDQKLNPEEDLLVVHLVSHGGRDGKLVLDQPGLDLSDLTPEDFAEMLASLQARRKVLVVSACYSGHWLNQLKDSNTMILASAREDRTSFGCGDDSEMTWFTKAVYQSVGLSFLDPEAMFGQIEDQIRIWEEDIGMEEESWSYPQYHLGDELANWLSQNFSASAK